MSDALETTFFLRHFHHPVSLDLTRPGGPVDALMPVSLHVAATFFHAPAHVRMRKPLPRGNLQLPIKLDNLTGIKQLSFWALVTSLLPATHLFLLLFHGECNKGTTPPFFGRSPESYMLLAFQHAS